MRDIRRENFLNHVYIQNYILSSYTDLQDLQTEINNISSEYYEYTNNKHGKKYIILFSSPAYYFLKFI